MFIRTFLSELKRRQVYRAVIVYATVAWALLESADIVFPRLGFEDWSINLLLLLVLVGFPFALVLAWIFDITPEGIFRTPPLSPGVHHHFSWGRIAEFLVISVLAVMVGYLYLDRLAMQERLLQEGLIAEEPPGADQEAVVDPARYRSIAVLPFADMSEAGDQAWFAEGVAEEILHGLAGVQGLDVMARTSSFAFKDTDKTIAEIADTLGVQAVLEGSVRRFGDRVRITAQLIDAHSGYHIWSESYERQLADIFQLQDALARSIVQTLRLELGVDGSEPLIAKQTAVPDAYNAFIRGRAVLDFASPQGLEQSIRYFEIAVEADPDFANAWGNLALARSYRVLWRSVDEVSPSATQAYQQALALDPEQSEALTAKALITQLLYWDWQAAGHLYQRALATGEHSYLAMTSYSIFYLGCIGKIPSAIRLLREAEAGDPLQAGYKSNLAMLYLWSGDYQAAISKAREALALEPWHVFGLMALVEAHTASGDYSQALAVVAGLPEALQKEPRIWGRVAVIHALQGDKDKAREIYRQIMASTPPGYANMQAAALAVSLGDAEQAIQVLEREVAKHSWTQLFMRIYFRNHELIGDDPRLLALLEQVGLDDTSIADLHRKLSF